MLKQLVGLILVCIVSVKGDFLRNLQAGDANGHCATIYSGSFSGPFTTSANPDTDWAGCCTYDSAHCPWNCSSYPGLGSDVGECYSFQAVNNCYNRGMNCANDGNGGNGAN